ncbi:MULTISPECIES: hypothetical protein [Frankia]|uniref:hypothetical protein n=1 Tax=Frankia TaxID=1854 RepID=UPI0021C1A736|nr:MULTISPECIES: hypothetical protein [Frankia]
MSRSLANASVTAGMMPGSGVEPLSQRASDAAEHCVWEPFSRLTRLMVAAMAL